MLFEFQWQSFNLLALPRSLALLGGPTAGMSILKRRKDTGKYVDNVQAQLPSHGVRIRLGIFLCIDFTNCQLIVSSFIALAW